MLSKIMKNSKQAWRFLRLLLFPVLIIAAVPLFHTLWQIPRQQARAETCRANLRQIYLAISLYGQDFNGRLPPTVTKKTPIERWPELVQPYSRNFTMFNCPVDSSVRKPMTVEPFHVSYWMNENLSKQIPSEIVSPTSTLLFGESSDGRETLEKTYSKTALPSFWLTNAKSPSYRHSEGANYLMADGTVHWLRPDEVTTFGGRKNAFALR